MTQYIQEFQFESGNYLGQVVRGNLLLADFSLTVGENQGLSSLCIEPDSLCAEPGSQKHFELNTGGQARFYHAQQCSVHVARQEQNSYRLVFDSRNEQNTAKVSAPG